VQYDAVLQPSQCGGPVIDILGRVVGLNIARAERTRTLALTNDILLDFLMEAKKASN
jgi:serine protease Do